MSVLSRNDAFGGLEGEMYDDDEIELNSQGRIKPDDFNQ